MQLLCNYQLILVRRGGGGAKGGRKANLCMHELNSIGVLVDKSFASIFSGYLCNVLAALDQPPSPALTALEKLLKSDKQT